jgi:hypothetical protein
MSARVARFEGDSATIDERVTRLRALVDSGEVPPGLVGATMLLLVDRESEQALGVTLFESEEAMRKADEAMNRGPGHAGSRSEVAFYEVPIQVTL